MRTMQNSNLQTKNSKQLKPTTEQGQMKATVKRLQDEGRMPTLDELIKATAQTKRLSQK